MTERTSRDYISTSLSTIKTTSVTVSAIIATDTQVLLLALLLLLTL